MKESFFSIIEDELGELGYVKIVRIFLCAHTVILHLLTMHIPIIKVFVIIVDIEQHLSENVQSALVMIFKR